MNWSGADSLEPETTTVVAEDYDADIVDLEVQRHTARAVGEFDHLAGLAIVEPIDAGDAVTDRQHLADLGDFRLLAKILDPVSYTHLTLPTNSRV